FDSLMKSQPAGTSDGSHLREWLVLHELALLGFQLRHPPQEDFVLFQRVLAAAQRAVSSWNGSLVFVYLPMPANFKPNPSRLERSQRLRRVREEVLRICASLSIPILDIDTRFAA